MHIIIYTYIYIYICRFFGFSTCLSARRRPPAPRETTAVLAPPAECLVLLRRRLGVLVSELWQDGKMMGTVCWKAWKAMESLGLAGSTLWFPVVFFLKPIHWGVLLGVWPSVANHNKDIKPTGT